MKSIVLFVFALLHALIVTTPHASAETGTRVFDVQPFAETEQAPGRGDAADDAEVWRNKVAPERSLILATDKKTGLLIYDLAGKVRQILPIGRVNNVDLREGWIASGAERVLVAVSDRTRLGISFFLLDPQSLNVEYLADSFFPTDVGDPYGMCMYRSHKDAALYAFITGKSGQVRQVKLTPGASGKVEAQIVRQFALSSISEGCVVDDRTGKLYIAEEQKGIWRYEAEPDGTAAGALIAAVDGTDLVPDIEGLTLAPMGEKDGYLLASVQGNSAFAVFSLADEKLIARFRLVENADKGVDEVSGTDGIALALGDFGPGLPNGLLVVQDDRNAGGTSQNFKLVSWADVLAKLQSTGR